jgi:hypothetical protein
MTQQEHLQKIRAKCEEIIALCKDRPPSAAEAMARSTIAAIDYLPKMTDFLCDDDGRGCDCVCLAEDALKAILAAWPEEIL